MQRSHQFHQTKPGLLLFGLVELTLAYLAASWAIDSGNLLLYLATIILAFGGLHNIVKLIWRLASGKRQTSEA
jgi:hypothetical protein